MNSFDVFGYKGKRTLVVGGATGMGAATAELLIDAGAEVVNADRAESTTPGVAQIPIDLADRASIDRALYELTGELTGALDAVFSCAGVADGTPGIERINFIGHRYLIDRLIAQGTLSRGGAIGMISSAAGLGWESDFETVSQLLDISDWDESVAWTEAQGWADYFHMKQAVCAYVARESYSMTKRGIRINAICPGPTDTPLAQANKEQWLGFGEDFRADVGIEASTAMEQAYPLVFLCSDAAAAITGQTLISDAGYLTAGITNAFPEAKPTAEFLLGRF